jgi:GGDEF domain-containing protein
MSDHETATKSPRSEAVRRALEDGFYALMEALRVHALNFGGLNRGRFQAELAAIERSIQDSGKPVEITEGVDAAVKCIEAYHRGAGIALKTAIEEHRKLVADLTESVVRMAATGDGTNDTLRELQKRMDSVRTIEELRTLRKDLVHCLDETCERMERHRDDTARIISSLRQAKLDRSSSAIEGATRVPAQPMLPRSAKGTDCGLEARDGALLRIADVIQSHRRCFAACFVVDRFPTLAKRFGSLIAERVQTFVSMELAQRMPPEDSIYSWLPGVFVILMERTDPLESVEEQFNAFSGIKLTRRFETEYRSVLLPLNLASTLIPLFNLQDAATASRKIEEFASNYY